MSASLQRSTSSSSTSSSCSRNGSTGDLISSNRVRVIVRCRPLNPQREEDGYSRLSVDNESNTISVKLTSTSSTKRFHFSCVADETKSQEYMFYQAGKPIVECALAGYNGAILTYGQTGSGKTFTMQGVQSLGIAPSPIPPASLRRPHIDEDLTYDEDEGKDDLKNGTEVKGLIQMVCESVFAAVKIEDKCDGEHEQAEKRPRKKYTIHASYLEIYNETLVDLLVSQPPYSPSSEIGNNINSHGIYSKHQHKSNSLKGIKQPRLTIREDPQGKINVVGLTKHKVENPQCCYQLLRTGAEQRKVAKTGMNDGSSRSHAIFTLFITYRDDSGNKRVSRLHLVDLAGSERQKTTKTSGLRLREAGGINKSLSALGNVINSISSSSGSPLCHKPITSPSGNNHKQQQQNQSQKYAHHQHHHLRPLSNSSSSSSLRVPSCRESKLTFLLKDALGGNSKLCVIATISPALSSLDETMSTLEFAQRCHAVKNMAVVNEILSTDVVQLQNEVRRLQKSLSAALINQSNSAASVSELCRNGGATLDPTSSTTSFNASGQGHAAHGPGMKKRTDVGCQTNTDLGENESGQSEKPECESCTVQKRQFEEEKSRLLQDLECMTEKCRGMITTNQTLWNTLLTSKHVQDINIDVDQLDGTVRSYMNLVENAVEYG